MKKSFLILVLSIYWASSYCQLEELKNKPIYDFYPYHFGFMVGFTSMDFTIHKAELYPSAAHSLWVKGIENKRSPGFNINIVAVLKLGVNWDLRFLPGLAFGQRNLEYWRDTLVFDPDEDEYEYNSLGKHTMKIESTFLQLPLLVKYRGDRVNNYRPYIIAGVDPVWDLEAQKKIKDSERPKIRLKKFDTYAEFGFGIDYYLPYFKFATELRMSVGLTDIVKRDNTPYTGAIDRMNSKMVTLAFYFE